MRVRVTASARKHRISRQRIVAAMANAVLDRVEGDYALYIGVDGDGVELEIGIVPDDRFEGQFAVIHCMPTEWRKK
jgi:hypothetical protein